MIVNLSILGANPFIDSFITSDLFGKLIFVGLIALSILSWVVLIYKIISLQRAKKNGYLFQQLFAEKEKNSAIAPLAIDLTSLASAKEKENPFLDLYLVLKKQAIALLNKNREAENFSRMGWLSSSDLDALFANLQSEVAQQIKNLEKYLYLLSTVVSLAPFIGLLGTVWGILMTFSHMQTHLAGGSQGILQGLSLALTTTVLGLVDAIPALIGYNYLKNSVRDFHIDLDGFAMTLISAVEMEYRPVDLQVDLQAKAKEEVSCGAI